MKGHMQLGRKAAALGGLLALAATLLAVTSAQASTSALKVAYRGQAWGAFVKTGNVFKLQPAFRAVLSPCRATQGSVSRNSGASANLPGALHTGTISNRVSASANSTSGTTRALSNVHNTNLLAGLVKANWTRTTARVTYTVGKGFSFGHGVNYGSLTVAGNTQNVHANTKISLPGIGYVILNQQKHSVHNGIAVQIVNAIHVVVTKSANTLGLQSGTHLVIGHAVAAVKRPTHGGPVTGFAFGTHAKVGNTASSGYSARVFMNCLGGANALQVVTAKAFKLATSGTVRSQVWSRVRNSVTKARASNTVQKARLLNGLVRADAVRASVNGRYNGARHRFSDTSTLLNLVVNGQHVNAKVNQRVKISGVGTLYVHRVIRTRKTITVRMLELIASAGNTMGLKTGTDIQVGVAHIKFLY
jgi:hypothetical protein